MATPTSADFLPEDGDGVRYVRVDALTVLIYVDGPGDTTIRPPTPEAKKRLERDRELIAEVVARVQREQELLNARKQAQAKPPEEPKQD